MRRLVLGLIVSLLTVSLAYAIVIENSTNKQALVQIMKRKGYTGVVGFGDTLYCGTTGKDTTIVYYNYPFVGSQLIALGAVDSVRVKQVLLVGYVTPTSYYFVRSDSINNTLLGGNVPKSWSIPVGATFFAFEVTGYTGNAKVMKTEIVLNRK